MTQEKIRIDIVSDVVCPWCAIGYWRLKKAIATCAVEHLVNVVWHPFELNPNMAESVKTSEHIWRKSMAPHLRAVFVLGLC